MQSLLVPIANKVNRLFPHENSTNLTDVLKNEEAICAGKVNVLLAISKYLGLNARANPVKECLDNDTSRHVCYECNLPSGSKLVVDTNFSNEYGLEEKTDDELIEYIRARKDYYISNQEINSLLRYTHLAIDNARFIVPNSRVLVYVTENTNKTVESKERMEVLKNNPSFLIRINPYTGKNEVWKASVPHPHLITYPDKDGYFHINSSFTFNNANFVTKDYSKLGVDLFEKNIEMNPNEARAYLGLAGLLPARACDTFLEEVKAAKPALYWEEMSIDHAKMVRYKQGDLRKAIQLFEETKDKNPSAYYQNLYDLFRYYREEADQKNGEEAIKLKKKAEVLIESARMENPADFYSNQSNIMEIIGLYGDQIDKKVEVYEQFKKTYEKGFWDADYYNSPFHELMELYLVNVEEDPARKTKAVKLAMQIRMREPRFYARVVHYYARGLFFNKQNKDPSQAAMMLEVAKEDAELSFFQEDGNIGLLAAVYEAQGEKSKAIALFEEAREKGRTFWKTLYDGGYSRLASLYAEAKQLAKAIAVYTEAQLKDPNFFDPQLETSGYTQLASLYAQNGQNDKAMSWSHTFETLGVSFL